MKFLCKTELVLVQLYAVGIVYDFTADKAEGMIAADKKIRLGALSYFTPVDDEAIKFVKDRMGQQPKLSTQTAPAAGGSSKEPEQPAIKQPTRTELIAEAKNLGIKKAQKMKTEDLLLAIAAAKKGENEGGVSDSTGTQPQPTAQG
jgi:hypothetical protein